MFICSHTLFPGNAPAHVRHANEGAEVGAFIPIYSQLDIAGISTLAHADNARRLLWTSFEELLAPLLGECPTPFEEWVKMQGEAGGGPSGDNARDLHGLDDEEVVEGRLVGGFRCAFFIP